MLDSSTANDLFDSTSVNPCFPSKHIRSEVNPFTSEQGNLPKFGKLHLFDISDTVVPDIKVKFDARLYSEEGSNKISCLRRNSYCSDGDDTLLKYTLSGGIDPNCDPAIEVANEIEISELDSIVATSPDHFDLFNGLENDAAGVTEYIGDVETTLNVPLTIDNINSRQETEACAVFLPSTDDSVLCQETDPRTVLLPFSDDSNTGQETDLWQFVVPLTDGSISCQEIDLYSSLSPTADDSNSRQESEPNLLLLDAIDDSDLHKEQNLVGPLQIEEPLFRNDDDILCLQDFDSKIDNIDTEHNAAVSMSNLLKEQISCNIQIKRLKRGDSELLLNPEPEKKYELREDEVIKKNTRLEQNRRSAEKSRVKSRNRFQRTLEKFEIANENHCKLQTELLSLKKERFNLASALKKHLDVCTIEQLVVKHATYLRSMFCLK